MIKYKTVFISDIHLGTKMSQAEQVLEFIKTFECEKLYLVGDIIDGWALYKSFYWPQSHNDVVQKMYMMKILFEDCDIINKWEKYKVKKSQQIYTFDEKEKFYEDIYKEYMKSHPDLDYFKQ